jgi:hypothetical protein
MPIRAKLIVSVKPSLSYMHTDRDIATLRLAEHVTNLYLHEIALHREHSATDLQPPFLEETLPVNDTKSGPVSSAHIGALGKCLRATHGILETMLSIPLDVLLTLPVIFCKCLPLS